jgi:2-oxoglutarate dehydrogenase E1 component
MRPMSKRCTKTTWPTPAACPTPGATASVYFDALQHVPATDGSNAKDVPHLPVVNAFAERAKQGRHQGGGGQRRRFWKWGASAGAVQQLIAAYRNVWAPAGPTWTRSSAPSAPRFPNWSPAFYGFTDADQETVFNTSNTFFGKETMTLRELLNALRETYCGTIGAEFMYLHRPGRRSAGGSKSSKASAASPISMPRRRSTSLTA